MAHDLYEFALFRFGVGTRHLMKWKNDTKNDEILAKINEQYKLYKKMAKRMIPYVGISEKARLFLFCISFELYAFIRNTFRK